MTFNKLIEVNQHFKELLLFICLLDSQNIPRQYLDQCKDPLIVSDFLHSLKKFSLITSNKDGIFSTHRSTQKFGLKHIWKILTEKEKAAFISKIVKIMTPYSEIRWIMYKTDVQKYNSIFFTSFLLHHLEAIIKNFEKISLSQKEKDKYVAKITLAIGHIHLTSGISGSTPYYLKALKLTEGNKYIDDYDLAVLYKEIGKNLIHRKDSEGVFYINKSLELANMIQDSEPLIAMNFAMLGEVFLQDGNFDEAIRKFQSAIRVVEKENAAWAKNIKFQIYCFLAFAYCDHYLNKR